MPRAWIQSLVEELRSHKLPCMAKKKKKKMKILRHRGVSDQNKIPYIQELAARPSTAFHLFLRPLRQGASRPHVWTANHHNKLYRPSPLKQRSLLTPWAQLISHRWLARISERWPVCGPNPAHSLRMAYKLRIAFTFFSKSCKKDREGKKNM